MVASTAGVGLAKVPESLPALPVAQERTEMLRTEMLRPLDEPMVIQLHVVHNLKFAIHPELGKIVPLRNGMAAMASRATTNLEINATTAGADIRLRGGRDFRFDVGGAFRIRYSGNRAPSAFLHPRAARLGGIEHQTTNN
jgi:hypothetical protein